MIGLRIIKSTIMKGITATKCRSSKSNKIRKGTSVSTLVMNKSVTHHIPLAIISFFLGWYFRHNRFHYETWSKP